MRAYSSFATTLFTVTLVVGQTLVPGNPALTREMVNQRITIWEWFLEAKLTPAQRQRFEKAMVAAWPTNRGGVVEHTMTDIGLVGKESELKPARRKLQAEYVENLRKDDDEESRVLLEAYEAAHPPRNDLLTAKGLGRLIGQWRAEQALTPSTNTLTGQPDGVSFTDSLILDIYADEKFHHLWAHSHCSGGVRCCKEYGTEMNGSLAVSGATLTLSAESGDLMYEDACAPGTNQAKSMDATREQFRWTLEKDPRSGEPVLCLSDRPFQFAHGESGKMVCYRKQKEQ